MCDSIEGLDICGDLGLPFDGVMGAYNSVMNWGAAQYGSFTAAVSVVCPPAGAFLNGLASGFNLDGQESNDPCYQAGQAVGLIVAVASLLTGPEDPVADAEYVRLASRAPKAAEFGRACGCGEIHCDDGACGRQR